MGVSLSPCKLWWNVLISNMLIYQPQGCSLSLAFMTCHDMTFFWEIKKHGTIQKENFFEVFFLWYQIVVAVQATPFPQRNVSQEPGWLNPLVLLLINMITSMWIVVTWKDDISGGFPLSYRSHSIHFLLQNKQGRLQSPPTSPSPSLRSLSLTSTVSEWVNIHILTCIVNIYCNHHSMAKQQNMTLKY